MHYVSLGYIMNDTQNIITAQDCECKLIFDNKAEKGYNKNEYFMG